MKILSPSRHVLLFAVAALARLAPLSDRDCVTNSTYPQFGPGDVVYRYDDLMSGPEPENRFSNLTSVATGSGAYRDWSEGSEAVVIRMSTVKQHVGEFAGQRLFNIIHDALLKICPYDRGRVGCYPQMPGAVKPHDDNTPQPGQKYYEKFWIRDVPYKTDTGNYASNAWLTITAKAIYRDDKYPGIGAATYEMAAGAFARATEVNRNGILLNCYLEEFNRNSRPYTFCNVPQHVLVALPVGQGKVTESWLSVTVEFNGNTAFGQFDCYNSLGSVGKFFDTAVLPDVTKSMGNSEKHWRPTCVECWDEDERFDVSLWREDHACDWIGW